jgi:hypothetical protein
MLFRTWLVNNVHIARSMARQHRESLNTMRDKVNSIRQRFQLQSIVYSDDWSVGQFHACLTTFFAYVDKWHEQLLSLQGITYLR